jgi:hypothetical protein
MTDNMAPVDVPGNFRPVQIATVHGAAVFLAENPTLPMPAKVELSAHVPTLEVLRQIAAAYGSEVVSTEERLWYWATVPVAVESLHGMTIDYTVFYREPETTPMDLPPRGENITTDPWADVMPPTRCTARLAVEGTPRCVKDQGHDGLHFYDDDEMNGAHGA